MNKKPECVELQSRLVEYFSDPPEQVPEEIECHLKNCEACRIEFEQTRHALELLKEDASAVAAVPEHLFAQIEERIEQCPQAFRPASKSTWQRNILILQYSYLATMAVIIWFSLMLGQPILNDWLIANELLVSLPLLAEYGIFILFFAVGGIFAAVSSPLIIRNNRPFTVNSTRAGFLRRLFTGLRMFAC